MQWQDALYQHVASWQRRITAVFWALAIGSFILLALLTMDSRKATWNHAAMDAQNLATALSRDMGNTLVGLDRALRSAKAALALPAFSRLDADVRQQLLFDLAVTDNHVADMFLLDRNGIVLADSGSMRSDGGDFSDRRYFTVPRDRPELGLFISDPFVSPASGNLAIALSRRVDDPTGAFAGVLVASLRYRYFERLVSNLHLGPGGSVVISAMDGTLIYGSRAKPQSIGKKFANVAVFARIGSGQPEPFAGPSQLDREDKLHAFQIVDGFPMLVLVNTPLAEVFAEWRFKAIVSWGIYFALFASAYVLLHLSRIALRRQALMTAQLEQTTGMFQAYFANAPDALFLVNVNLDGRFTYVEFNPVCETLIGLRSAFVQGKAPAEVFPPVLAASIEARYRTCIELGRTYAYSTQRELAGAQRDLHTILAPIAEASGRIVMIIGSIRDLTEEHRALAERGHAKKMEALGRLTAGIAHDFNNHLQTIGSSLELLDADYLNGSADARDILTEAVQAAASGAKLTNRLLAFSRQQVLRPARVSVAQAFGNVARDGQGSYSETSDIQLKLAIEAMTGDAIVDPAQLEACLANLLSNARDAVAEGGRVVLHARNARPAEVRFGLVTQADYVVVAVQDTGIGMNEEVFEHAFDPFFTTKTFGSGAGLGLSMVQGVCQQSGGDARILRATAGGTRVELWLPSAPMHDRATQDSVAVNRARFGNGLGRVLLVSINHELVRTVGPTLVAGGFEVVSVDTAERGLGRLADRERYDVVLLAGLSRDTAAQFERRAAEIMPCLVVICVVAAFDSYPESLLEEIRDSIAIARDKRERAPA